MTDFTSQLITIYARCPCRQVGQDVLYRDLCRQYDGDDRFHQERDKIENYKDLLEKRVGIQVTPQDQVAEALKLLKQAKGSQKYPKFDDCINLTWQTYSDQWSDSQKSHFNKYSQALQSYYDYFLSFTTRNADESNENTINRRYKYFIKSILKNETYEKYKTRKNLFAEAIHSFLKSEGPLKGYYFPEKEMDNSYVDRTMLEELQKTFIFVQIVQNIMFLGVPKNYCFLEYDKAVNHIPENCRYYILAEKGHEALVSFADDVCLDYDGWFNELIQRDKIVLEFTEKYNLKQILDLKQTLKDKLVHSIKARKQKCLENVPVD